MTPISTDYLIEAFGYWEDYPEFPSSEWQKEVKHDETRLSYWEWVVRKIME